MNEICRNCRVNPIALTSTVRDLEICYDCWHTKDIVTNCQVCDCYILSKDTVDGFTCPICDEQIKRAEEQLKNGEVYKWNANE